MIDRQTLHDLIDLINNGGTVVCNATTRDCFLEAFRIAGVPSTGVRFRVSPHLADGHVRAIALDSADPEPYALTAEATP